MGLSLRNIGKKIVDVFSADTEEDQRKRLDAGQQRYYADQQRAMGNKRPATNPAEAFFGGTARLINTAGAGLREASDTARMITANLTNNPDAFRSVNEANQRFKQRAYQPDSGLLSAGTIFDDPQEFNTLGAADITKRVGATMLGTAGEVLPVGRGLSVAKQGVRAIPKIAGQGAVIGAAGDIGDQYIRTGQVDPRQVALSAATGGVLSAAPPIIGAGVRQLPKVSAKGAQVLNSLDERGAVQIPTRSPVKPKAGEPKMRVAERLSPDRQIRALTGKVEEKVNKAIYEGSVSENPIARASARLVQGISREAGAPQSLKTARRKFRGTAEFGKVKGADLAASGRELPADSRTRVWATIDTDQAAKMGNTVDPTTLTPEERALRQQIIDSIEETTKGNFERGLITPEQAANPNYLKRAYEPFEGVSDKKVEESTRTRLMKQFRGRKDVSDDLVQQAITDPAYLAGKKAAQSHQAWALVDYSNFLADNGFTFPKGGKGMVQLPQNKLYGKAAGQWVPKNISDDFTGFQYTNSVLNAFNDIITAYDKLGIRRAKKQLLTVFNPAVRLGNQVSNRMFAVLNGHNPVEYEVMFQRTKGMMKNRDPLYLEAVQQGLTNSDITRADFAKNIAEYVDDPEILKQSGNWFQRTYSQADDKAKLASYAIHRAKGYSPDEAARLTQRGFQDYGSVGFFYDMAAKMPVVGNAFVRFAGDSLRIGKNALVDHPLRAVSLVAAWATFTNVMSKASGETPEDRETREDRFGAPKLPFTDISLTTQTPWGEVNVARFLPFYNLNEIGGEASRFLPVQTSPVKRGEDGGFAFDVKNFQDPLLGQVAQLIADEDFRGKSIQDPENTGQFTEELPQEQKNKNLSRFLATQNIPLAREADAIVSAATGGKDIYGKTRSLPQAALRAGGVKVEQFGPEQARENRATKRYFSEKEQLDKELASLPKSQQESYKKLTGYYKLRDKTPNEFEPGEERYVKAPVFNFPEDKWKEYTQNPEIYDLILSKKQKEQQSQGKPIQPEFDTRLSKGFRAQLINNKSLAPGEDVEADERMYSNPEWDKYLKLRKEYQDAAGKYYPKSDKEEFADELVKHKTAEFPTKPAAKVAYDEAYSKYIAGKGPKPSFTDQVKAARDQYSEAKREWTNRERTARGLPPIDQKTWENKTFGFTPDRDGGRGYDSGGGGKGSTGSAYKYAVSLRAGGEVSKPKVSVKKTGGVRSTLSKSVAQPKVTLKKGRV
jgi:hypothetical protein